MHRQSRLPQQALLAAAFAAALAWALPGSARGREIELLGVRAGAAASIRMIERDAATTYRFEHLRLLEIPLDGTTEPTIRPLVTPKDAARRQRAGLMEIHRQALQRARRESRDQAELDGFRAPSRAHCYAPRTEAHKAPRTIDPEAPGEKTGYAWTCVLVSEAGARARVVLAVGPDATEVRLARQVSGEPLLVARVEHSQIELRYRGVRLLPVVSLHRSWVLPASAAGVPPGYLLVMRRSRLPEPEIAVEEVAVLIPPGLSAPQGQPPGRVVQREPLLPRRMRRP